MNTSATSEPETKVELFSSSAIRAAQQKKLFRRRLVFALFVLPKLLAVAYVGALGLVDARQAKSVIEAAVSFIP